MITDITTSTIPVLSGEITKPIRTATTKMIKAARWPPESTRLAQSSGKRVSSSVRAARTCSSRWISRSIASSSVRVTM